MNGRKSREETNGNNDDDDHLEHVNMNDDDDDDDDDMAPLVTTTTNTNGIRSSLEIEIEDEYDSDDDARLQQYQRWSREGSPLNCSKITILFIISAIIFLPLIVGYFVTSTDSNPFLYNIEDEDNFVPSCAEYEFNQTFEELLAKFEDNPALNECWERKKPENCNCPNPTIPVPLTIPRIAKRWNQTYARTKYEAHAAVGKSIDLVLLGDSITEHWHGTDLNYPRSNLEKHHEVYNELFTKVGGGKIDSVNLGIAAERCPNLLYRLREGVLDELHAKVMWVLIGTNDFGGNQCSVESVVAGNIAIVEELLAQRSDTTVVVNGILPRGKGPFFKPIAETNRRLRCYASLTERVEYFDADDVFYNATSNQTMNYLDGLHPDGQGSQLWGELIVEKVLQIIGDDR